MELITSAHDETMKQIERVLKYENSPFTQNSEIFSEIKNKFLARCREIRAVTNRNSRLRFNFSEQASKPFILPSQVDEKAPSRGKTSESNILFR